MKQKEYIGSGSILCLRGVLAEYDARKIFLVTGKKSYSACGAKAHLDNILKDYKVYRFCEFTVNPKVEDIERGINIFRTAEYDMVIAVGGGSTIDMAKAINFLAVHSLALGGYKIGMEASDRTIRPLIAIPTTSGSGSEATHFAVVYAGRQKYSIADERMLPKVAIIDADLTESLPRYTTAVSGVDALSQAVESYWSIHSTSHSKRFAGDAIKSIVGNLPVAVNNPSSDSRGKMAEAAHLAGKAINITSTTAAHSISYPLTSHFAIPHGHAVGLTLPSLLEYNARVTEDDVLDVRGISYVRKTISEIAGFLGTDNVEQAKNKLDQLLMEIGLETRLSAFDIKSERDIELIIRNGFNSERVRNNPRLLTEEALRQMLNRIR